MRLIHVGASLPDNSGERLFGRMQEGELVKVSDIDSERVRFGKLPAAQHGLLDCLQPILGATFTYQRDEPDWLGLDSIVIRRLRDDLQPAALNKRFRHNTCTQP